ncbi:MAG: HlyD family secretion protein [Candidatus Eisenbacteria bacterium]
MTDRPERAPSPIAGAAVAEPAAPLSRAAVSTATSETPASPAPRRGRRPIVFALLGIAALVGLVLGAQRILWARTHVSSDDAQVEGHIIPVLAKVGGYITAVEVSENQMVTTGQTLVLVDDREYRQKLAQAEADLNVAIAMAGTGGRTGQAVAQVAAAEAAAQSARVNATRAQADAERYRALAERQIVSRQQLDAAVAAADAAAAQLTAAEEQTRAARSAEQGADARVAALRAARDQAALNLSYTRIVAPDSGVVSRKTVEVGQLVQPGQTAMTVVPLDDVWIVANLKETEVADVNPGDHAVITVDSYPGRRFAAHVESLSPATGARFSLLPPDNATGNFTKVVQRIPVRLRLDRPNDPARPLRPGMSVVATITTK